MNIKSRNHGLDLARCFAILAVLLCHSIEFAYPISLFNWPHMVSFDQRFRIIGFTAGRLGVPLFLALSGYFLLAKPIKNSRDCISFYKTHLLPLLITYEIWLFLYQIFMIIIQGAKFYPLEYLKAALLIKGNGMIHIWYMPMILGLYLVMPFLTFLCDHFSIKLLLIPYCVALFMTMIIPNISHFYQLVYGKTAESPALNVGFPAGYYGLYLFAGYFSRKGLLKKIPGFLLIFFFFVSAALTCMYQDYMFDGNHYYDVWYDFFGLYIAGISLFELFTRIPARILPKPALLIISALSNMSLGIYFLHMPVLIVISMLPGIKSNLACVYTLINWSCSVAVSVVVILLLQRIKVFRKWLFLMK